MGPTDLRGASGGWITHQLAELIASINGCEDGAETIRVAVERTAEALEAEAAAATGADGVAASFGFGPAGGPEEQLSAVASGGAEEIELVGFGRCDAIVAPVDAGGVEALVVARSEQGFDADEINLLRAAGQVLRQALIAVETTAAERSQRIISERRRVENERLLASLSERSLLLERLSRIQTSIVNRMAIDKTLEAIVEGAAELFGEEFVALRLVDEQSPEVTRIVASHGVSEAALQQQRVGRVGKGAGGRAIAENRLVAIESYATDAHGLEGWRRAGVNSAMAAPVRDRGEPVGSLVVATGTDDRRYTEAERETLTTFAQHASIALTDAKTVEAAIHQGLHDPLTGLPNRQLLLDRLEHALALAERSGKPVGVLFLDLDGFKMINDSLGHSAGDEMLKAVGRRLASTLRPGDTPARFGGDEFVILIDDVSDVDVGGVAQRVLEAFEEPFSLRGQEVFTSCSIGIAIGADPSQDLLRNADLAMYRSKSSGPGAYAIFEPHMHTAIKRRLSLAGDLRRAVRDNRPFAHYQPIWDLRTGRLVAVEALVRWEHPTDGMIPPLEFIPLAEETGLVVELGRQMLFGATAEAAAWRGRWPSVADLKLNVNVSVVQLEQPTLIEHVRSALAASGLPASSLVLELTETALADDARTVADNLRELDRLGVGIAIDDFGTGYSSLAQLKLFPISMLKIPKEFIDDIDGECGDPSLAEATIEIGSSLGQEIVAEGIERPAQARRLVELGARLGQGFDLARPMAAEAIDELLRKRERNRRPAD